MGSQGGNSFSDGSWDEKLTGFLARVVQDTVSGIHKASESCISWLQWHYCFINNQLCTVTSTWQQLTLQQSTNPHPTYHNYSEPIKARELEMFSKSCLLVNGEACFNTNKPFLFKHMPAVSSERESAFLKLAIYNTKSWWKILNKRTRSKILAETNDHSLSNEMGQRQNG